MHNIALVSESFKVTNGKDLGLLQTMKSEVPPGQTDVIKNIISA